MIPIITVDDISQLIAKVGLKHFYLELVDCLQADFAAWHGFRKNKRLAEHLEQGVLELMPICGPDYYSFKYVNGHPKNPFVNKQTVVAIGVLADIHTGYPLLISEMTLLTALRTAATSALAARYLAKNQCEQMAIIGTGAQSEFQVLAMHYILGINRVKYYDRDPEAMKKFAANLAAYDLELIAEKDIPNTLMNADIVITATAAKIQARILENDWILPGMHLNVIGGDCPGKTELDPEILLRSKIVVEFLEQTQHEGEIQHLIPEIVYAELWELAADEKPGRLSDSEITLFDSVGFALEDYSILRYVYQLEQKFQISHPLTLIPDLKDPKNLFGLL